MSRSLPGHVPPADSPCHHPEGKHWGTKSHFEPGRNQTTLECADDSTSHQSPPGESHHLTQSVGAVTLPHGALPAATACTGPPHSQGTWNMNQNIALAPTASTQSQEMFPQGSSWLVSAKHGHQPRLRAESLAPSPELVQEHTWRIIPDFQGGALKVTEL